MDRRQKIKQHLLPYRVNWMNEKVKKIKLDSRCRLSESLFPILEDMMEEMVKKQDLNKAEKAAILLICYLRSSFVTRSHEYLIMMADNTLYLDRNRCERYWYPERFYKEMQVDIIQAQNEVMKHFIRVSDYENEFIRKMVEEDYLSLMEIGLSDQVAQIPFLSSYQCMSKQEKFRCFYGEYMGEIKEMIY